MDPVYTNDPDGLLTPLNCHIRLANPQTPQTAATSKILRRSYQYDRSPDVQGSPDMGHVFCCFQNQLATYIAMQTRLEDEMLARSSVLSVGAISSRFPGSATRRTTTAVRC